jgi:hypothetical protein
MPDDQFGDDEARLRLLGRGTMIAVKLALAIQAWWRRAVLQVRETCQHPGLPEDPDGPFWVCPKCANVWRRHYVRGTSNQGPEDIP